MRNPYDTMDEALEVLSGYGPDLANGMTSHAPMAAEALCAMGRPDAVLPWIESYRKGMLPRPTTREKITRADWRAALGQSDRTADWSAFFEEELREAPWREIVARWTAPLSPAICASAVHGAIRTGHAVRSLEERENPLRVRELADGLGYWAANFQVLPTDLDARVETMRPREAMQRVPLQPQETRVFAGSIVSALVGLDNFPQFASIIATLDVAGDANGVVQDLTDVFARVFLDNAHDLLTAVVFVHGVTGLTALGHLLPHLDQPTRELALRYAWQSSCGLYCAFGRRPFALPEVEPVTESAETLIEMAVASGDEHAIKFAETCLTQDRLAPSPAYRAAVRRAVELLQPS